MLKVNLTLMRYCRMNLIKSIITICISSTVIPCLAQDSVILYNKFGQPTFSLSFFSNGDIYQRPIYSQDGSVSFLDQHTNNDITLAERQMVIEGFSYWKDVIQSKSTINMAVVAKQGIIDGVQQAVDNATGESFIDNDLGILSMRAANGDDIPFLSGIYTINPWFSFSDDGHLPYIPLTLLPKRTVEPQMGAVALHEGAHMLGMISLLSYELFGNREINPSNPLYEVDFDIKKDIYDSNIYDINGTNFSEAVYFKGVNSVADAIKYKNGYKGQPVFVIITPVQSGNIIDIIDRYVCESGMYFKGPQVSAVLNGALLEHSQGFYNLQLPGIPIQGIECLVDTADSPCSFTPEASHLELNNSLLSHQSFRNWTIPMEVELAMFQDLGYKIDRRRYFGNSIYHSGTKDTQRLSIVNVNPYYERNSLGTAYLTGSPSTQAYGIGLHVYGSYLDITQHSELLSIAPQSAGIRLEGRENRLLIDEFTHIAFNGDDSYGLLVDYGKHHHIKHLGSIEAIGKNGIAAAFDFGGNILGISLEIGSTFLTPKIQAPALDYEKWLNGPLVDNFDIYGALKGQFASIYIADNAYVQSINIYDSATIDGDIISYWDPLLKNFEEYGEVFKMSNYNCNMRTELNLLPYHAVYTTDSMAASNAGRAVNESPLTLSGNIIGTTGLNLVNKTFSIINGYGQLYSVTNEGSLIFDSKDSDGYNLQVSESINMHPNSYWGLTFTSDGITSRIKAARVNLAGDVLLSPDKSYFPSGKWFMLKLDPNTIFRTNNLSGSWLLSNPILFDNSQSLSFTLNTIPESSSILYSSDESLYPVLWLKAYRDPQAYTMYAKDQSSTNFAYALLSEGEQSDTEHEALIANFDFTTDANEFSAALQGFNASSYDAANYAQLRTLNLLSTVFSNLQYQKLYSHNSILDYSSKLAHNNSSDYALNVLYHNSNYGDGHTNIDSDLAAALLSVSLFNKQNWQFGINFGVANLDSDINLDLSQSRNDTFNSDSLTLGVYISYVSNSQIITPKSKFSFSSSKDSSCSQSSYYALLSGNYHYLDEEMDRKVRAFGDNYSFSNDFNGHAFTASMTLGYRYTNLLQNLNNVSEPLNASANKEDNSEEASTIQLSPDFTQWSIGPFVSIDFLALYQQNDSESDALSNGGALQLYNNHEYSLPLSLGIRSDYVLGWKDGNRMSFNARAAISHELLSNDFSTEYQLRNGHRQVSTNSCFERDTSFNLNVGMSWQLSSGLQIQGGLQCEYTEAEDNLGGYLQAAYAF